jgi:hypothetical protein
MEEESPSARSSCVLLNIAKSSYLLFGGGDREKTFNDFWILKIINNSEFRWTQLGKRDEITPRFGTVGGIVNNKLYLHGGQNFFTNAIYGDTLMVEFGQNYKDIKSIENLTSFPIDIKKSPINRNSHTAVQDGDNIIVFGGGNGDGLLNDLWLFDTNSLKWNNCELNSNIVSPREMFGMVKYTNKKSEKFIYILGGRLLESIDDKMYRISLEDYKCELVCSLPMPLCSFACVIYKYFIIIYGGTDGNTLKNDIMIYNITNSKWAQSKTQIHSELVKNDPSLEPFLGKIASSISVDNESEELVIFGGSSIHKDTDLLCVIKLSDLLDENNLIPF